MAAAVELARAGQKVVVFEAAKELGGRARLVRAHTHAIDNGQHILLGAYAQTLELLRVVHGDECEARLLLRRPLHLEQPGCFRFSAPRLPAPFHLAVALARARGLTLSARIATVAFMHRLQRGGYRCAASLTAGDLLAGQPEAAVRLLWNPLCLAALNTPVNRASAQIFLNVLQAAFANNARDSDLLLPIVDLSTLFPQAAADWLRARGSEVGTGQRASHVMLSPSGVRLQVGGVERDFGAAIIAVGPHQYSRLFAPAYVQDRGAIGDVLSKLAHFAYEPISTVYLRYRRALSLPQAMLKLDDAPGQWVFDRGQLGGLQGLAAVVISTGLAPDMRQHLELTRAVAAQLARFWPGLPTPEWTQVITEQRASYACVPALDRPSPGRLADGLYLAGDYTDPEFPATLEAATRSGVRAARAALMEHAMPAVPPT